MFGIRAMAAAAAAAQTIAEWLGMAWEVFKFESIDDAWDAF